MIVTNSLTGGGAERSMNLVSNELARRGWPVALVPINSSMPDLVTPTCEIFCLNRHWRGNAINTLSAFVKFNQLVCSWKPDVIILNCDLPELFGALVIGTPSLVVLEHSNIAWANRMKLGKGVRRILSIRDAIWVAVSSHLKIWPNGRLPKSILQNPVTPTVDSLTVRRKKSQLQRLVFIGRLTPEKQPNYLLEIGERSGLVVEIMGEGFMKESLHEQAVAKSLRVTFSGQTRDPWSFVRPGDLLIVPSASEGDGLVVIEGMKRRVPVLLSDIPDFRRFGLPDRNYCQSIDDFVAHIDQYRDNIDSLVVPEEISTAILNSRSLEVVGNSWENFLDHFD
jgi:glycosyltransferase involved in cell wall biosynthesis